MNSFAQTLVNLAAKAPKTLTHTSQAISSEDFARQCQQISRQAATELAAERVRNRRKRQNALLEGGAGIPRRFADVTLENSALLQQTQPENYAVLMDYQNNILQHLATGSGLILWGDLENGIGVGKTHAACCIANHLMALGRSAIYKTAISLIAEVKATWKSAEMTEAKFYKMMGEPDLLIIDELGVQSDTDFVRNVMTTVIDARFQSGLPTIAISNNSPRVLKDSIIGLRAFDRLTAGDSKMLRFIGKSLRIRD